MTMLNKILKNITSIMLCLLIIILSAVSVVAETESSIPQLTEEQKNLYYAEYQKIVEQVNEDKGKRMELQDRHDFSESDWVHPIEFRRRVIKLADSRIDVIREPAYTEPSDAYSAYSSDARSSVSATKTFSISATGSIGIIVNVDGRFESRYAGERQVFSKVRSVTSSKKSGDGEWKQISYEDSFMDGYRTCKVIVSGKYTVSGVTDTKLGTAYFYMKDTGKVY